VKGRADARLKRLEGPEGYYHPRGKTDPTRYVNKTSAPYKAALAILEAACAKADAAVAALTEQLAAVPGPAGPAPPPPAPPPPVAVAPPFVAAAASTAAAFVPTAASFMVSLGAGAGAPQRLPTAPPPCSVAFAVYPDSPPSAPPASSGGLSLVASGTTPLVDVTNRMDVDGGDVEVRRPPAELLPHVSLAHIFAQRVRLREDGPPPPAPAPKKPRPVAAVCLHPALTVHLLMHT